MRRIFVLDDNQDIRDLALLALRVQGFEAQGFALGQDLLTRVRAGEIPDAIFVDLGLPGMGGRELIEAVRSEPGTQNVRYVIASGHENLASVARDCGAQGFLRKPFGIDELGAALNELDRPTASLDAK
jgi:DNA-binding response OmpR family regulator